MIYTVGKTSIYEKSLDSNPKLDKLKGGSVWKTINDVEKYLEESNAKGYSIYGIEADWNKDTYKEDHGFFRSLNRDARIIRL